MNRLLTALLLGLVLTTSSWAQTSSPVVSTGLPKALVVVGPWGDLFRWREAMHAQGVWYEEAYRAMNVYHGGVRIYGLPQTAEQLGTYSTVVLVNMDAPTLGEKNVGMLRDFVHNGGGLVVLGGEWAFQRGGYAGTALAEMLPVEMTPEDRIPVDRAGLVLRADEASAWPKNYAFDQSPRSFYAHTFTPKPNATVELRVGERPAVVSGSFGKGRVVACGLTIHGLAPTGTASNQTASNKTASNPTLPFWEWADWPRVLGYAVDWSAAGRPASELAKAAVKPLTADEISQVQTRFEPLTAEFAERFAAAPSAPAAAVLFEQLFAEKPTRITLSPAIVAGLARFAEPSWEKQLLKWTDSLNPEAAHRNAAIELLGASRGPAAGARLVELLPDVDAVAAAIDGLRRLDDPTHLPLLQSFYERSVATADFRMYGMPAAFAIVNARQGIAAVRAAAALYALGDPQGTARLAGLYREIRLLRRIHANAAKRRVGDTDAQGQAIREAIIKKADDLRALEAYLLEVVGPIPPRARTGFIEYAKTATDDAEIRWLATGLLHSQSDDWSPLADAQDGIVRRIAQLKP